MADDWGNTVSSSKQYDDNTDEAPDDWEAELEKVCLKLFIKHQYSSAIFSARKS